MKREDMLVDQNNPVRVELNHMAAGHVIENVL